MIYLYFVAGLMVPIRLGTINIVTIVQDLGLSGKLTGLIPIYVAMGLPITAFVLTTFMRDIPLDLMDAARMDGASEIRVFWPDRAAADPARAGDRRGVQHDPDL